jgi:hypothetical protein
VAGGPVVRPPVSAATWAVTAAWTACPVAAAGQAAATMTVTCRGCTCTPAATRQSRSRNVPTVGEGFLLATGQHPPDEVGRDRRVVPAARLAAPPAFQVLGPLRHVDDDGPRQGRGGVLGHVFAGADQPAADLARRRRVGVRLQAAPAGVVGVGPAGS